MIGQFDAAGGNKRESGSFVQNPETSISYNAEVSLALSKPLLQSEWEGAETLYHRDYALLYIPYVRLIWAAPIPADRWHCSLWP